MRKPPELTAPRAARSTHTMRAGESLASVALKHYGDARFARLISTINRGDVPTRSDGFSSFAFVSPGQVMVLPTYEEANIFSGHFFTKQSQTKFDLSFFARPAMPSDSIPLTILPSQGSRSPKDDSTSCVQSMHSHLPGLPQVEISGMPVNDGANKPSTVKPSKANQFECQYIVRMPGQKADQELINMAPPVVNTTKLQDPTHMTDGPEVVTFSHYCRMIKFEVEGGQSDTVIKLQVREDTRWQTITAYIITEQNSRRLSHYADKQNQEIDIALPCAVARELSISDLKRNWKEYVHCYLTSQSKIANFTVVPDNGLLQVC